MFVAVSKLVPYFLIYLSDTDLIVSLPKSVSADYDNSFSYTRFLISICEFHVISNYTADKGDRNFAKSSFKNYPEYI